MLADTWKNVAPALPRQFLAAASIGIVVAFPAWGYEQATHAALTREAYVRAKINPSVSALAAQLGLQAAQLNSLGRQYIDIASNGPVVRLASPADVPEFAADKIRRVNDRSPFFKPAMESLPGWLMLGAIREDDVKFDRGALENNPQDEPGGAFDRVLNHFYDPFRDRALFVTQPLGAKAPEWALGSPPGGSQNHFNVAGAREAMWRALTLKQVDASGTLSDLPFPPGFAVLGTPGAEERYGEALRLAYWATTFRALGDLLHLLQDMAQPQHTRNDPHSGLLCSAAFCPGGHASYYEKYADARAMGVPRFTLRERFFQWHDPTDIVAVLVPDDLVFSGYPDVSFTRYRDFFATATLGASLTGAGLANYSNQGFFTAGTNIDKGGAGYPSPPPNTSGMQMVVIPAGAVTDATGTTVPESGSLVLFKGSVQDYLNPGQSDPAVALSSHGAFDQFMQPLGQRQFTLNHYNYDDQARLQIPRAVAYSAGFLDYFFRGQLEINLPSAGAYAIVDHKTDGCLNSCGFRTLKLKLKNMTPGETLSNGFFVAVAKFQRNNSYQADLSGDPGGPNFGGWDARSLYEEIIVSNKRDIASLPGSQLITGAEAEVTFTFPTPIPINATDIDLQVVFRGTLGNEIDAVVVATRNIAEPNYITFENDMDYRYFDSNDTFQAVAPDPPTQTFGPIAVKLGGATAPVATLPQLAVRGYARLAFLTDFGSASTERLVIDYSPPVCCSLGSPFTFDLPIAAFDSPGSTVFDRTRHVTGYRGLWGDYLVNWFQGSYAIALCVAGDTRRICTSAGLTALTPANAVAWTINFP